MAKTLKEVMQPDNAGSKRFKDKHIIAKTKDANGNGDDVFNATNIKVANNHAAPQDAYESVVEAIENLDEVSTARLNSYIKKAAADRDDSHAKGAKKVYDGLKSGKPVSATKDFKRSEKREKGVDRAVGKTGKFGDIKVHAKESTENEFDAIVEAIENLDEISKERVAKYVVKSVTDREKANRAWSDSQKKKMKTGDTLRNVKKAGPDKDYGETDANHADRVKRLEKRYEGDKKSIADADRRQTNRNRGLHRAGKILAKESTETIGDLLEAVSDDAYAIHHKRATKALAELQGHIEKHAKLMTSKQKPWGAQYYMKNFSRTVEDMAHEFASHNENHENEIKRMQAYKVSET